MSIRERVEEDLTVLLMHGYQVHFSYGDPVVRHPDGSPAPSGIYYAAKAKAAKIYQRMLDRVDWNRLGLEAYGAWISQNYPADEEFGADAEHTGQAIRMALSTTDTFPNWGQKQSPPDTAEADSDTR